MAKQWNKKVMKNLNRLAEIIREKKHISLGALAVEARLGYSTIHGYKHLLLDLYEDIEYEDGEFKVVEELTGIK